MSAQKANPSYQVSFDDAWCLWREVEDATGARLECTVHPPRPMQGGRTYPAMVSVQATRKEGKKQVPRAEHVQIGGPRGARTVPAALVRALSALSARLEEATDERVKQSAF